MMRKLLVWSLLSTLLAASTALAADAPPPRVPPRGTEGPDVRVVQSAPSPDPAPGVEGPAIR